MESFKNIRKGSAEALFLPPVLKSGRRGVRVVEGARLESVYSGNAIAGSNPALSAREMKCPARDVLKGLTAFSGKDAVSLFKLK
jgi:hypothetical protein